MPKLLSPRGTRVGGIRCDFDNNSGFTTKEEDWHFDVEAERADMNREFILYNTPGLPIIGYTISNGMLCKSGDAQRDEGNALIWRVTLTFSNAVDSNDASNGPLQQQGDPTLWVPIRSLMFETKEELMDTDASGNPCVNTADMPFETKMPRKRYCPAWEFTQFEPLSVSDFVVLTRNEVMNEIAWLGGEPKTWFCRVIDSTVGFYAGFRCRKTIYRVVYDYKKWTDKRLSVGWIYKSGSNRLPYVVRGQTIQGPLDSSGNRVIDENGATISGRTIATVELDPHPVVQFASFLRLR